MDPGTSSIPASAAVRGRGMEAGAPAAGEIRPYRVLALDGGGLRGYYTVRLLALLVEQAGGDPAGCDIARAFDLLVGTSTGSILAAALALGTPLARLEAIYRENGATIFPSPSPSGWTNLLWCARHWRRPSGRAAALRDAMRRTLGNATLGDVARRRGIALAITATDLRNVLGRVFATPVDGGDDAASSMELVDACAASCAAPMLLPPVRAVGIDSDRGSLWCDGGLWATSPLFVALEEAFARAPLDRPVEIVSVGTCAMPVPARVVARPPGAGIGFWIRALRAVQVTADAQARATVSHLERLAPLLRREVRVLRVLDPEPTDDEAAVVRLDNASPEAWSVMDRLAVRAATLNLAGEGGTSEYRAQRLRAIFAGAGT